MTRTTEAAAPARSIFDRWSAYALLAAKVSIALAVAAFVWRRNRILGFGISKPLVKPSDILAIPAIFFIIVAYALGRRLRADRDRMIFVWRWTKYLAMFAGFCLFGSAWNIFVLGNVAWKAELAGYARLALGGLLLCAVLYTGYRSGKYVKVLVLAFFSALVLVPALVLPLEALFGNFLVVSPASFTFMGLHPSTAILAHYLVIPLALMFALYLPRPLRDWRKWLFGVVTILLTSIMLWTGSRAGWLGAAAAFTAVGFGVFLHGRKKTILLEAAVFGLAAFIAGWLILAPLARNTVLVRIFRETELKTEVDEATLARVEKNLREGYTLLTAPPTMVQNALIRLPTPRFLEAIQPEVSVGFEESRGSIWKWYIGRVFRNPLGVGPTYRQVFSERNMKKQQVDAHSVWIETLIMGGVGAFVVLLVFFARVFQGIVRALPKSADKFTAGLFGAFVGTLTVATFTDALEFRWQWVLVALVILAAEEMSSARQV